MAPFQSPTQCALSRFSVSVALASDLCLARASFLELLKDHPRYRIVWSGGASLNDAPLVAREGAAVTILDARRPDNEHLEHLRSWSESSNSRLLLVRSCYRIEPLLHLFSAGVHGLIAREDSPHVLRLAMEMLASGGTFLSPVYRGGGSMFGDLEPEDRDLLRQLALGRTYPELAHRKGCALAELIDQGAMLMQRIGCETREQLLGMAIRQGLLPVEGGPTP